jgi:hypothetical protein
MSRPVTRLLYLVAIAVLALGLVGTCVGGALREQKQFEELSEELLPAGATLLGAQILDGHHVLACRSADSKLRVAVVYPPNKDQMFAGVVKLEGLDLVPATSRDPSRFDVEWFDFSIDRAFSGEIRVRVQEEWHNEANFGEMEIHDLGELVIDWR